MTDVATPPVRVAGFWRIFGGRPPTNALFFAEIGLNINKRISSPPAAHRSKSNQSCETRRPTVTKPADPVTSRPAVDHRAHPADHPRTLGWIGTTSLAMGGSNQSLFLMAALIAAQGSAAVPLLLVGLLLAWAALPGWIELVLMWPKRVGGISATCAEAFRPYSPILANLTGVCYWWGWIPTCGLTALLSASALHTWYQIGRASCRERV